MNEYAIGTALGVVVAGFARWAGMDRDRSFYATVLIVVASYDTLFAVMGASNGTLGVELAVGLGFATLAVLGFKKHAWLLAVGIAGHGVFDMVHHLFIENSGMPVWWPGFCASIDIYMGGWLGFWMIKNRDRHETLGGYETGTGCEGSDARGDWGGGDGADAAAGIARFGVGR